MASNLIMVRTSYPTALFSPGAPLPDITGDGVAVFLTDFPALQAAAGKAGVGLEVMADTVPTVLPGTPGTPLTLGNGDARYVQLTDGRLGDPRVPLAHAAVHKLGGSDELPVAVKVLGSIVGKTSAQIDAMYSAPVDGLIAQATVALGEVLLFRKGGKWYSSAVLSVIA